MRSALRLWARLAGAAVLVSALALAQAPARTAETAGLTPASIAGLRLRSIGPGIVSGRIVGLAVEPGKPSHYYVAAASGGVWETTNDGATFTPIFDHEGSYSIGAITLDPSHPTTVWVGTGENNAQRTVSYGDGVYRSDDGGASWRNLGLKDSRHIGRILVDPRDSNVVYVAAEGPLWGAGGDRGVFKTTDGGATWKNVLSISEHTGVSDLA
ncbi:MAG: WD40/YVTN/BNR-like repeat-containing protein, partial [Terriglobales bacterium]